jgi:hypothetical protein
MYEAVNARRIKKDYHILPGETVKTINFLLTSYEPVHFNDLVMFILYGRDATGKNIVIESPVLSPGSFWPSYQAMSTRSGGENMNLLGVEPGSQSGTWRYDTRGLRNPKVYHAARKFQPGQQTYLYVIGKTEFGGLRDYELIFGPDTFENCRKWLISKGFWKDR